jgi:hypothetical protein
MFSATLISVGAFFVVFGLFAALLEAVPSPRAFDRRALEGGVFSFGFGASMMCAGFVWRYLASGAC